MPPTPFELLDFLCATLARRPEAVPFRLGAAAARYLDILAYALPAGPERQRLLFLSKVIWGRVFQFAKFQTATKEETIQFLQDFSRTHLATYNVAAAIETMRSSGAAARHVPPRILRSPGMSVTLNPRGPRLSDDLTERICAAYWAFRLAGISKASGHVAKALNNYSIPTRSRKGDKSWTSYEVAERVKQHEPRMVRAPGASLRDARRALVEKWNALYYPIPSLTGSTATKVR
jgi:hypothetical protein